MWESTKAVCLEVQCAKIGYNQSDEITIFAKFYEENNTESWFDNNLQKIATVAASTATSISMMKFEKHTLICNLVYLMDVFGCYLKTK